MINDDRLELDCVPTRVALVELCVAVVCAAAAVDVAARLLLAVVCLILCAILCEVLSAAWL